MRRAARRLVETRSETFESRHPLAESRRRLDVALAKMPAADRAFGQRWSGDEARPLLEATFAPSPRNARFLRMLSIAMSALVGFAVWGFVSSDAADALAWIAAITTVLAILGFPFVVLGLASHQDARESRIRRAIRNALQDEEEKLPPPQR
jgi:hypothetical protein